jgi:hypothetical protein
MILLESLSRIYLEYKMSTISETLVVLREELLELQYRISRGTYDDLEFFTPIEIYFKARIKELERPTEK